MKKLVLLSMAAIMAFSIGCDRHKTTGTGDNQKIQRQDEIKQKDINSGTSSTPSNVGGKK